MHGGTDKFVCIYRIRRNCGKFNAAWFARRSILTTAIQRIYDCGVDFEFLYDKQWFVWNIQKADLNKLKHGIDFEQACLVFFDPLAVFEDASTYAEHRQAAIGHSADSELLFVVHLAREDDVIRIISARRATRKEIGLYENNNGTD